MITVLLIVRITMALPLYQTATHELIPASPSVTLLWSRDGKETELSKNEPNQNPGFTKNGTEPEPKGKNLQESEQNRTEPKETYVMVLTWFFHSMKL